MGELPKIVAQTDVGKNVNVKIWRNKREIIKVITPVSYTHLTLPTICSV